jgi:chaperonin GroES
MSTKQTKEVVVPLGDRILVAPISEDEYKKSKGGIIIPETVSKERPERGRIVAVGKGKRLENGTIVPVALKKGQVVLFAKYSPTEIKVGETEYYIISESDVLAGIE